ncbi:MAG TPA: YIP1 family protein [Terriglobales bacterium]|nr:YIP1 family protein [Terriglobales bacterium]
MQRLQTLPLPTYEEVEKDASATGQALAVVILSSIAAGLGQRHGFVIALIAALLGWFAWAFLIYFIGTKLLFEPQTHADVGQLLPTTGFSAAPGLLRVLGIIPLLGPVTMLFIALWTLVAMIIAVRQALDYTSTWRAIGVSVIGWIVYMAHHRSARLQLPADDLIGSTLGRNQRGTVQPTF